jgi:hypothetical protein
MTQPSVNITELDGALGVLPPSTSTMLALYGVSTAGTAATPQAFGTVTALKAALGGGPLVEAAAHYLERYGNPVLCVKASDLIDGTFPGAPSPFDAVNFVGTGTSVATIKAGSTSDNAYEVRVDFVTGGTRGSAGITYRISLDGGRTYGKTLALGTGVEFVVGTTGITVALAAGTLVAGDYLTFAAYAPSPDPTVVEDDLAALGNSAQPWSVLHYVGPVDTTLAGYLDAFMDTVRAAHKPRMWVANTAVPVMSNDLTTEDEATYSTALETEFSAYETTYGCICAGDVRFRSSLNGGSHRRPVSFLVAAREASVSDEINIADVNLGPFPSATITDSAGNPQSHDESIYPGLDDLRFCVLRSWPGLNGVYVNRPRLFSGETSDFQLMPHRRVMNLAHTALYAYFVRRLNAPILVNRTTGYILESVAKEIEAGAEAALRTVLGARPKASGWSVALSRTDNILSTKTLTVTARIIPLGYAETIDIELGFSNPALVTSAA